MIDLLPQKTTEMIAQLGESESQGFLLTGSVASNLPQVINKLSRLLVAANNEGQYLRNFIKISPNDEGKIPKEMIEILLSGLKQKQGDLKRVVVIENLELLHVNSYNAMLKSLEEPGKRIVFILTTTDPKRIPATVVSRLQHVQIPALRHQQIIEHFKESDLEQGDLRLLSYITEGDINLIAAAIEDKKLLKELMEAGQAAKIILGSDTYNRLILSRKFSKDRAKSKQYVKALMAICSSAMRSTASSNTKAQQWAGRIESLLEADRKLEINVQPRLIIQQLMVQL